VRDRKSSPPPQRVQGETELKLFGGDSIGRGLKRATTVASGKDRKRTHKKSKKSRKEEKQEKGGCGDSGPNVVWGEKKKEVKGTERKEGRLLGAGVPKKSKPGGNCPL